MVESVLGLASKAVDAADRLMRRAVHPWAVGGASSDGFHSGPRRIHTSRSCLLQHIIRLGSGCLMSACNHFAAEPSHGHGQDEQWRHHEQRLTCLARWLPARPAVQQDSSQQTHRGWCSSTEGQRQAWLAATCRSRKCDTAPLSFQRCCLTTGPAHASTSSGGERLPDTCPHQLAVPCILLG